MMKVIKVASMPWNIVYLLYKDGKLLAVIDPFFKKLSDKITPKLHKAFTSRVLDAIEENCEMRAMLPVDVSLEVPAKFVATSFIVLLGELDPENGSYQSSECFELLPITRY
jgi:hypothetical protein